MSGEDCLFMHSRTRTLYLVNFEVTNLKSFFLAFAHFPCRESNPEKPRF
jgi:hypothetical protein